MRVYLKVRWIHNHPQEPVWLISELDEARNKVRKVESFADGAMSFASASGHSGSTRLGETPIPPNDEILKDPQFEIEGIDAIEFQRAWESATQHGK